MSRTSRRSPGVPANPHVLSRSTFLVGSLLLALPLVLLGLAPSAALAHPAYLVRAEHVQTSTIGKSSGPTEDLTLHYHSTFGGFSQPYRMGTDAQGDL